MFKIIKTSKRISGRTITVVGITIAAIVIAIFGDDTPAGAWDTDQSVRAECVDGEIVVYVTFKNRDTKAMNVDITVEGETKTVVGLKPGEKAEDIEFNLGVPSTPGGSARIFLTWNNGHGGSDDRSAPWSAESCPVPPSTTSTTTTSTTSTTVSTSTTVPPSTTPTTAPTVICPDEGVCAPSIVATEPPAPTPSAPTPTELAFTGPSTAIWRMLIVAFALIMAGFTLIRLSAKTRTS